MSLVFSSLIESCLMPGIISGRGNAIVVGANLTGSSICLVDFSSLTFVELPAPTSGDIWTDVDFNGATGYTISNNNYVARSTDYGLTWTTISILPSTLWSNGRSIKILGDGTVLAGGASNSIDYSTIWRSTNGGLSWSIPLNISGATSYFPIEDFYFIDNSIGYAVGYKNLFKTYNGGSSWSAMNAYIGALYVNKISINGGNIFAANVAGIKNASVFTETTWATPTNIATGLYTSGVYSFDSTTANMVSTNGYLFKITGTSTVASSLLVNSNGYNLRDIYYDSGLTKAITCGDYGALHVNFYNSNTWNTIPAPTGYTFYAAKILNT